MGLGGVDAGGLRQEWRIGTQQSGLRNISFLPQRYQALHVRLPFNKDIDKIAVWQADIQMDTGTSLTE